MYRPHADPRGWSRRHFLRLLGVGALAACRPPREPILPYVEQPPEARPGRGILYATSVEERGFAIGLLVESRSGRPTKIDGHPDHPASLGATVPWHQAAIFDLYDRGRARYPRRSAGAAGWSAFVDRYGAAPLPGLHFVLPPTGSPLLVSLIEAIRRRHPGARFHFHDPLRAAAAEEASTAAFGGPLLLRRRFDRAKVVLAIESDFLAEGPCSLRWAREFAATRIGSDGEMSRLYAVEADLSRTGAIADHRLRVRPREIPLVLAAVARAVGSAAEGPIANRLRALPDRLPHGDWAAAVARDLLRHRGACQIVVGDRQPPECHLLAHALDALLGNVGRTVERAPSPVFEAGSPSHDLAGLLAAIDAGEVRTLVLLEVDPVRDAFADDRFAERLREVPESICLAEREGATARSATWFLPALHWLEGWGDGRAFDGTVTFRQPLIRPLFGGSSAADVLAVFAGAPGAASRSATWRLLRALHLGKGGALGLEATPADAERPPPERDYGAEAEMAWREAIRSGLVPGSALAPVRREIDPDAVARAVEAIAARSARAGGEGLCLLLRPDPKLGDGRSAHNDRLLELPDPITRIAWQNPVLIAPATARRIGVEAGDLVEIDAGERRVQAPALPWPGIAEETAVLSLGWGATPSTWPGPVGTDFYPLRTRAAPWTVEGAALTPVRTIDASGKRVTVRVDLPATQVQLDLLGRPILLHRTLAEQRNDPGFAARHDGPRPSLYPRPAAAGPQWGMAIDLARCIGCGSCVLACQAENNVPVVGPVGVAKGRAMHWLRIDRYLLGGSDDDVQLLPQPMLCQHCEQAPCEYVCPVNATVHSPDGLNEMVYNRCIGTRFCSNNCPYKVRRFNYFEYNGDLSATERLQRNPDVTVRARGVMEKCTFCVQRIRREQIEARLEAHPLRPIETACQAACPTEAIAFGLLSDPASEVAHLHADPRAYRVLQRELGTEPRIRYLLHLRNPNEEIRPG